MVVVTVEDFNVNSSFSHPVREQAELAGDALFQSLHENVPLGQNADADCFQRLAGGCTILEEKMGHAVVADDPRAPALDADTGTSQRLAHFGERARAVFQNYC